jgi:D-beta-D-heptose 7-phosphate kinase/D-beta-D-heptose 1-phosphate adenosyltransferase
MKKKVLVIGDVMLDKYIETEPVRISDEAPVLICKETEVSYILGGAGNTAANLKAMGFEVILQGLIGEDESGERIYNILREKEICNALKIVGDFKTTVKSRILCKGRQVIRIDSEHLAIPMTPLLLKEKIDAIVVSDYAKGIIGEDTIKTLKDNYDVPVIVNGKPKNIRYYIGADILVINKKEADEIIDDIKDSKYPDISYSDIAGQYNILYVVVTKGDEGIEVYSSKELYCKVLANEVNVKDITGAGDTVTAAITLEIVNSGNIENAIMLANRAGGIKVTKDKTSEVSLEELNYEDIGRPSSKEQKDNLDSERIDG